MAGVALGVISRRGADDVAIGSFFSWILGLGALFLTYYTTHGSGNNGTANVNVLFGSIFGINDHARTLAVTVAVGVGVVLIAIARPLLFATVDPAVAQAAGVPTRLLGTLFLVIVGVTVAEATQIIGALVVLGLLAAPAAAAARLTTRPWQGFWLSAVFSVAAIWIGVTVAYAVPAAPATFTIMSTAATIYLIAAVTSARGHQPRLALRRRHNAGKPRSATMPAPPVLRRTRMTAQQRAVLDLLQRSDRFRSAQQLHLDLRQRHGVRIGLVTVYRILHAFADMKITETQRAEDGEIALPAAHHTRAPPLPTVPTVRARDRLHRRRN